VRPTIHTNRLRTGAVLWTCCLLSVFAINGCGKKGPPATAAAKVLLIGLDGAEWDLIRPMVAAGELPHLARLMKEGSQGSLRSLQSLATSPTIWTTIATGKSPAEHGIGAVAAGRPGQPRDNFRRVLAAWNIASMAGRTTGIVGWPASGPAEQVNGFLVSDYLPYSAAETAPMVGRTSPAGLAEEIAPLVARPTEVHWNTVQRFLDAPLDTTTVSPQIEELLAPIRWISAADLSFARIAEELYRERRPDFFAVCLRGMESMGDHYWNYMTPDAVPAGTLRPEGVPYLKGAMRAYYRFTDELVGRILALADEQTTILLVSDHGFQGEAGRGGEARKVDGIILVAGRNAGRGEIAGATVYDVTPTVLVLLGLPPARDMGGKVLWSALGPGIHKDKFAATLDTYETGNRPAPGGALKSPVDKELKERLRSLGYTN
jgi:predicted AlkP superfamily phosphohydrolase/phosphomutase